MDLKTRSDELAKRFCALSRRNWRASVFVKVVMIAVTAAIIGIAQFAQPAPGQDLTGWQIAGIASAAVTLLGALFVGFTEHDASSDVHEAKKAIELARESRAQCDEAIEAIEEYVEDSRRAIQLYSAMSAMRAVVEQTIAVGSRDQTAIVEMLMTSVKHPLPIAMGVEQADQWTICIYKAEPGDEVGRVVLRCVAQHRALECDITKARIWPEGVGIAGQAYAGGREVIVPDMADQGLGTIFDLGADRKRDYDSDRYKSLAAVPVLVNSDRRPWGVVVGTNDVAGHFSTDHAPGIGTIEALRALAGMVALGVSVSRIPVAAASVTSLAGQPAPINGS